MSRRPTDRVLRELVAQKLSDPAIAERLGVTSRTVFRWRTSSGITSLWEPERHGHGTHASYNRGCRCAGCTRANTEYHRDRSGSTPRPPLEHGSVGMYVRRRCRCDTCRAGNAARARKRYAAKNAREGRA